MKTNFQVDIETDDSIQAVLEESEAQSELENYHSTNFLKELASWSFIESMAIVQWTRC